MSKTNDTVDPMSQTATEESQTVADKLPVSGNMITDLTKFDPVDRYELRSVLASGGMGTVWLAHDSLLGREVAVKVLHPKLEVSGNARSRFENEARLTGRLDHPGIVPVYDFGRLPQGDWFFAMRRIQGVDLREHLDEILREEQGDYPLNGLLRLFSQVCMIVAYAHDRGCIHRDLKPSNILVGSYGELYVADWGIAKIISKETGHFAGQEDALTDPDRDSIMGTAKYMSPEHILVGTRILSEKSDVFSLGIMLVELVTGQFPFEGECGRDLMTAIVDGRRTPTDKLPSGKLVPGALQELFDDVLASEQDQRPSARQLAQRINRYLDGVEDRQRAARRAKECLKTGIECRQRYVDARFASDQRHADIDRTEMDLRERKVSATQIGSGDALNPYLELWQVRREVDLAIHESEHWYNRAVQALEQALNYEDLSEAREILADLYWEKYEDATRARDQATALFFKALVEEHDSGKYKDRLAETGNLHINISGDSEKLTIERYVESGPLLLPEATAWSGDPLPVGSYRARIAGPNDQTFFAPFRIDGNQLTTLTIRLPDEPVPGFQYIHGGITQLGGDPHAPNALDALTMEIPSFWMAQFPVTVEEYVDFLNHLALSDVDQARCHAPRSPSGNIYVDYDAEVGAFIIPAEDSDGDAWEVTWPIMMVNQFDALAYCAWRSQRDDRQYRLPTEHEWEYAARGVDGRIFPWGNGYDRLISCSSRGMNNDRTATGQRNGPACIDEFPYDVSPFGVRHMGGLTIEWTSTTNFAENVVMRGGGLFATESWCRAATRYAHAPERLGVQFGFRLAMDAVPTADARSITTPGFPDSKKTPL